jgi:hypothetical protein
MIFTLSTTEVFLKPQCSGSGRRRHSGRIDIICLRETVSGGELKYLAWRNQEIRYPINLRRDAKQLQDLKAV